MSTVKPGYLTDDQLTVTAYKRVRSLRSMISKLNSAVKANAEGTDPVKLQEQIDYAKAQIDFIMQGGDVAQTLKVRNTGAPAREPKSYTRAQLESKIASLQRSLDKFNAMLEAGQFVTESEAEAAA